MLKNNTLTCEEPLGQPLRSFRQPVASDFRVFVLLAERPEAVTGKYPFLGAVVLVNQILDYNNTQIRQKHSDGVPFEIRPEGALASPETCTQSFSALPAW